MQRKDSAIEAAEVLRSMNKDTMWDKDGLDLKVLGVCGGSGLNALDFALVWYRQDAPNAPLRTELLQHSEEAVASAVQSPILDLLREVQSKPSVLPRLNAVLGRMFANGIKAFAEKHSIDLASIDLIGTHTPPFLRFRRPETDNPSTHPYGWNAIITAETGITAIFDFVVAEGPAAKPLASPVAFVDRLILRHPSKFRACLNIGELANLSFIPPLVDGNARGTISRDCGPGSLLIDYAMRYCTSNENGDDHDGKFAAPGNVNQDIVLRFLQAHDYLRALPPLSIAREMFGDHEAQRLIDECLFLGMPKEDTIATITRITAQNILKQYRILLVHQFPQGQKVDELFICGPSARNSNIIDYLEAELPESVITKPLDDIGIPGDANDAVCYAHLALETLLSQGTWPSAPPTPTTIQAGDPMVRGRILRGKAWESLLSRLQQFSNGKHLHVTRDVRVAGNLETAIRGLELR